MGKSTQLHRRTFLQGVGSVIALPFLEAMIPSKAYAQALAAPMRLGVFCFPFGTLNQAWSPTTFGANYTMPANLSSLIPFRNRINLTRGLGAHGLPQGSHMAAMPYFTTEPLANCTFQVRSKSADMRIADFIRQSHPAMTPLVTKPGSAYGFGGCYTHAGNQFEASIGSYLSWAGPQTATSQLQSPQAVFDKLFTNSQGSTVDPLVAYRKSRGLSVLDSVLDQATSISSKVGSSDKQKLDQYFTALREVERKIASANSSAPVCTPGTRPPNGLAFDQEMKAFLDLAVLAMACDKTRVVTHILDTEADVHRQMPWLGLGSIGHHLITHTNSSEGGLEPAAKIVLYQKVTAWYASQLAYLLNAMQSYKELDKDLLYNSLIVYGSGMGPDGASHNQFNLSVVLAGELQGKVKTGQALDLTNTRMANLWLTIMNKFGLPDTSYNSSTGSISL